MKKCILPFAAALAAVSLMGFGCNPFASVEQKVSQKVGEKVAEGILNQASGGKVSVDAQDGQYSFKDNKTGASYAVGENVSIPDTFPKDVPLYAGAKALTVSVGAAGEGDAGVTLQTTDDVATVTKWYEGKLKSDGWTQSSSATFNGSEIRAYEKGEVKLSLSVIPGGDEEKRSVITIGRSGGK